MGKAKKLAAPRARGAVFNLATDRARAEPLVLVVVPSRELALQIFDEARRLCYRSMLRPCVVYGGTSFRDQRDDLARGCDVLIATPGRLIDALKRPDVLVLSRVK
jgi:ATP-dependent RNA helicase DDX3X